MTALIMNLITNEGPYLSFLLHLQLVHLRLHHHHRPSFHQLLLIAPPALEAPRTLCLSLSLIVLYSTR